MTGPTPTPRRRKFLFAGVLLLGGLLLGLGAVEITLRVFDPYEFGEQLAHGRFIQGIRGETPPGRTPLESFYLRPNAHVEFLGATFDFNADGYRTPAVPRAKPEDVYRIVVVGDSVPFGWGVPEPDCFPRKLETMLNQRDRPFGRERVEVVNLSGPGRGLGDYYLVLRDEGLSYQPDLIVIPFIFNDVPLHLTAGDEEDVPPPLTIPGWGRGIYTVRWVTRALNELRGSKHKTDYWIGIRSTPEAARLCCVGFQLLHQLAGDVPLVVFDTVGEEPGKPLPEVARCTAELGVPRIECYLPVVEWSEKWAIDPPVHVHPNVAAHQVYAQAIVDWMEERGWVR